MQKLINFVSLFFVLAMLSSIFTTSLASNLEVGFYRETCPSAEKIVKNGCDASILLDSTPGNQAEKENPANNPSLVGYEVIDEAKAKLEAQCPETVSCADIIAFAARDSASKLGGINYAIKAGRRDGIISNINGPNGNIPPPSFNLEQLQENFNRKGLSLKEMVTLSGAHSIGVSHCSSFTNRLYSFNATHPQDPSLDPSLANVLKGKCPNPNPNPNNDPTVPLDSITPNKLDNIYFKNLQNDKGLLTSDQALMTKPTTIHMVKNFGEKGGVWAKDFAKAMVRMGSIEVLSGTEGEIRRNCRKTIMLDLVCSLFFFLSLCIVSNATLEVGFYQTTCPLVETIVRRAVNRAITQDRGLGAGLIRMHFHDCFVRVCKVVMHLYYWIRQSTIPKESSANGPSLRGFELIDEAKAELEFNCPKIVSCADILALAARDSIHELGGFDYQVPLGRRDGRVSINHEPLQNLPSPNSTVEQLQKMFATKGLNLQDMVALSGAHSIGHVTQCSTFSHRLHTFNATHVQDPSMDVNFASEMKTKCPNKGSDNDINVKVPLDGLTPHKLDNTYYMNLEDGRGLLASDEALMHSPLTSTMVRKFAKYGRIWVPKFVNAMTRMGSIEVLTSSQGEIRRNCRVVNLM
ncbi:Peroxidase 5 [Bienertia sinuspersici]